MSLGLIGRKIGMMRIFTDAGVSIPVTVVDVSSNRVAQLKTLEQDGYTAVQLAYGSKRASRVVKAQAGHFAAASIEAASSSLNSVLTPPSLLNCSLVLLCLRRFLPLVRRLT